MRSKPAPDEDDEPGGFTQRRTSAAEAGVQKPAGAASSVFDMARGASARKRAPRVKPPPIDLAALEVEKGVPIPEPARNRGGRYGTLLQRLTPNTSAALPVEHEKSLRSAAKNWQDKNAGVKFAIRRVSETDVRIWRTA